MILRDAAAGESAGAKLDSRNDREYEVTVVARGMGRVLTRIALPCPFHPLDQRQLGHR
jgi:hypothetical protein